MSELAILTTSYRGDAQRFARLHRSVLAFTGPGVEHHVIVPHRDLGLFGSMSSDRMRVWDERELLPSRFVSTDWFGAASRRLGLPSRTRVTAVEWSHPWPPVRGWVLQQMLKLALAPQIRAKCVLVIDSDVEIVRSIAEEQFIRKNAVRLYERSSAITDALPRHRVWTEAAHRLLGLPAPKQGPHPDYVGGIVAWDPELANACLKQIEVATGMAWACAFARELHVSEFILYGTFVRHYADADSLTFVRDTTLCHSHWDPTPLDRERAIDFVSGMKAEDVAIHVQSTSDTPGAVLDVAVSLAQAMGNAADSEAKRG